MKLFRAHSLEFKEYVEAYIEKTDFEIIIGRKLSQNEKESIVDFLSNYLSHSYFPNGIMYFLTNHIKTTKHENLEQWIINSRQNMNCRVFRDTNRRDWDYDKPSIRMINRFQKNSWATSKLEDSLSLT